MSWRRRYYESKQPLSCIFGLVVVLFVGATTSDAAAFVPHATIPIPTTTRPTTHAFAFVFPIDPTKTRSRRESSTTRLFGKGFQSAKSKQAALAQKMKLAKQQQPKIDNNHNLQSRPNKGEEEAEDTSTRRTIQDKNDDQDSHAEFAKLLAQSKPATKIISKDDDDDGTGRSVMAVTKKKSPLNTPLPNKKGNSKKAAMKELTKSDAAAMDSNTDMPEEEDPPRLLRVGDKASRRDWEHLVDISTGQPLGPVQAAQRVPWVPPFLTDYLVVVADPRCQSNDLRLAVQYLAQSTAKATSISSSNNVRFMAIGADAQPKELVAWKKRANIDSDDHSFDILLDSSALDWMTTYSCTMSWSLHFLILDTNGIIRYNEPRVDPSKVCHQVAQALSTLENQDE